MIGIQDEPVAASRGYMQALRLWQSAIEIMRKFSPKQALKPEERNPFDMDELTDALPEVSKTVTEVASDNKPGPSGWNWVLAEGLFETYLSLAKYQFNKGNYRDAEYFVLQANELAGSIDAPTSNVRALCFQAELTLYLARYDDTKDLLENTKQYSNQGRVFYVLTCPP